ncbi:MAG: DUF3396 domain-containing protein [Nitrospira sp.]|uniref:type VI immunity family protein n=1 Tax=Thauera sp. 2A1 TaxID=2570191 RepID=UPI001292B569|nr:type VI immunity family protein [Thauera sp. 2A1]KAI5916444.1 DUF3396 domain-containing protein [Thauera sp. 2A1]MBS0173722.1 DUF3396 domain-containing protein [Nitrospira sp.]
MKILQYFELQEEGIRLTSLVLATTIFFDGSIREHGDDLLAAWSEYRDWCPPESMNFYSTETMSKHKAVTQNTLGMLQAWFAPGSPERSIISFEVKDGKTFDETPRWLFDIVGIEGDLEEPSLFQITVPYATDPAVADRLRAFTCMMIGRLDASHAVAGVALACSPYEEETAQTFARARSMRHRGVDILLREADRVTVGRAGVKGANWLTFIDQGRVQRLGGEAGVRSALDPAVELTSINGGLLMRAGPTPAIGDENRRDRLPLYRSVFRVIEPLTVDAFDRALDLVLEDDEEATELSQRWRRRLAE